MTIKCLIHTNQYSGPFEQEMCAYITGITGELMVGSKYADVAEEELTEEQLAIFNEILVEVNESDFVEFSTIAPTPGWSNDGYGNCENNEKHPHPAYQSVEMHFNSKPSKEIRELIESRAKSFPGQEGLVVSDVKFYEVVDIEI